MSLIPWLLASALAAEVVWLDPPPTPGDRARVADAAGAERDPLAPMDLRVAATAWGPADDAAYETLEAALRDVRRFETQLDGELVIMRDLQGPIDGVSLVRDRADRDRLFAALAYQGFAVDRFFADDLGQDERAAPYRVAWDGVVLELPWADAVALAPGKDVTPYEIAEAPQRIAFGAVRRIVLSALPGEVRFEGPLPSGAEVVVDGEPATPTPSGGYRVVPGRHLVHVAAEGRVLARYDLRVGPGASESLAPPTSDATWDAWLSSLRQGTVASPPRPVAEAIEALGGEVWVVWVDRRGDLAGAAVTAEGPRPVSLPRGRSPGTSEGGLSVGVALSGGWLYSGDFYTQDPTVPHTRATVNAPSVGLEADLSFDVGLLRAGVGLSTQAPLGAEHVARYGDQATRLRPHPFLLVGHPLAQATFGWVFPYHPAAGARLTLPLTGGLEARASALFGFPTTREREAGDPYTTQRLHTLSAGAGWRF